MTSKRQPDWPAAALALAQAIPRERLDSQALAAGGAVRGPWPVAFSGGADSLALLLLLWAHWPDRRARILALHFDHRLRGRASRDDARFCERVCAALGVHSQTGCWADAPRAPSEGECRAARHGFFQRELAAARGRVLWLGHQQDDIAETLLMRIARGSGVGGLAAPRPVQRMPAGRRHLRPLLGIKKSELVAALAAVRIPWREDASNAGDRHFRNRVRKEVIPGWIAASGRDALAGAALSRALIEEDDEALDGWLAEIDPVRRDGALDLGKLAGRPVGLVRRALRLWLGRQAHGCELSRQGFDGLLALVRRGRATRFSLGAKGFAVIGGGAMRFEKAPGYRTPRRS